MFDIFFRICTTPPPIKNQMVHPLILGKRFVQLRSLIRIPNKHFYRLENPSKLPLFFPPLFQTIMDKSLGTLLHFWGVFQVTQVQPPPPPPPPPHPANNVGLVYPEFFSRFQLCIGWGRENCKKISKTLHCFKEGTEK